MEEFRTDNRKSQRGFSLIQTLIASSIMIFVALGLTTFIERQASSVSYLEDKLASIDFERILVGALGNNEICGQNFRGFNIRSAVNKTAFPDITDLSGNSLLPSSSSRLEVSDVSLQRIDSFSTPNPGRFQIEMNVKRRVGGQEAFKPIQSEVFAVVDQATGEITDCSTQTAGLGLPNLSSLGSCGSGEYLAGFDPSSGDLNCQSLPAATPATTTASTGSGGTLGCSGPKPSASVGTGEGHTLCTIICNQGKWIRINCS